MLIETFWWILRDKNCDAHEIAEFVVLGGDGGMMLIF